MIRFPAGKFRDCRTRTSDFFHFNAGRGRVAFAYREPLLAPDTAPNTQSLTVHTFICDALTDSLEAVMITTNTDPSETCPVQAMPSV